MDCTFQANILYTEIDQMKPALFAAIGILGYVVMNVMIEQRLKQSSPLANSLLMLVCGGVIILPLTLLQWWLHPKFTMPPVTDWRLLVSLGLAFAFADYFFLKAYNSGGSLIMISTMVALFPVFASILNSSLGGAPPSYRQWLGWAVAVAAIVLVSEDPAKPNPVNASSTEISDATEPTTP